MLCHQWFNHETLTKIKGPHNYNRTTITPVGNDQKKKTKSMLEDNKTANNHHLQYNQSHDGAHWTERANEFIMNALVACLSQLLFGKCIIEGNIIFIYYLLLYVNNVLVYL